MGENTFKAKIKTVIDTSELKKDIEKASKEFSKESTIKIKVDDNSLGSELNKAQKKVSKASSVMNKYLSQMGKYVSWNMTVTAIDIVSKAMEGTIKTVVGLDKSLTELAKVSDLSERQFKSLANSAFETGKQIGRTGIEVIDAMTEFTKAGYSDEAENLAKVALMYTNIADEVISVGDASSTIIAIMKAFKVEANGSASVIDKLNAVSNNFSVTSGDLTTAIPKVSATLAQANNTLDQTIGLVTGATELMPGQASKVARALRSITLNLQGMNDEGEEVMELVPKMETEFKKIGLTLLNSDGSMKSTYEILQDLSSVWGTLPTDVKNTVAALIGGKQNVDVLNATLLNFENVLKATETATHSLGSATRENEVYLKSIEGKWNKLKSTLQSLANDTLKSDVLKAVIDVTNALLELAQNIGGLDTILMITVGIFGLLKARILAVPLSEFVVSLNAVVAVATNGKIALSGLGVSMGALIAGLSLGTVLIAGFVAAINLYNQAQTKAVQEANNFVDAQNQKVSALEKEKEALEKLRDKKNIEGSTANQQEIQELKEKIALKEEEIEKENTLALIKLRQTEGNFQKKLTTDDLFTGTNYRELAKNYKILEDQVVYYTEKQAQGVELTKKEAKHLQEAQRKLARFADTYDEAKDRANKYYDLKKKGVKLSEEELDFIRSVGIGLDENNQKIEANAELSGETQDTMVAAQDTYKEFSDSLKTLVSEFDMLSNALTEQSETGGLSINTVLGLLDANSELISCLEFENGVIRLNEESVNALANAKINEKIQTELMKHLSAEVIGSLYNEQTATYDLAAAYQALANAKVNAANAEAGQKIDDSANKIKILENIQLQMKSRGSGGFSSSRYGGRTSSYGGGRGGRRGGGGGSRKASTATKERDPYKPEIDSLYRYKEAIERTQNLIKKEEAFKELTDNMYEQEKITRKLVALKDRERKETESLRQAQANQIENYIAQLRQQGFMIDYNRNSNELYIHNLERLTGMSGDHAKKIEDIIKKTQSLNKDNADLSDTYNDLTKDIKNYNQEIAEFPEKRIEKFKELLDEFQQSHLKLVEDKIADLEHAMAKDEKLKSLKEQLELLEKQTEQADKQQAAQEKILAVEKAKEALENAKKQKNTQIFTNGQWQWSADPEAVAEAEQALAEAQKELEEFNKDQQKEELQQQIEAIENSYQKQIDALQEFLDEQEYLIDKANRENAQSFEELRKELDRFGLATQDNMNKVNEWLNQYTNALKEAEQASQNSGAMGAGVIGMQGFASMPVMPGLSGASYTSNASYGGNTINIHSIALPNVTNPNEFLDALNNLPRLAFSEALKRR